MSGSFVSVLADGFSVQWIKHFVVECTNPSYQVPSIMHDGVTDLMDECLDELTDD